MIGLDILKKSVSFPWRPGDKSCWVCCYALISVLVLQLVLVFKDYCMVTTTIAYNKFSLKSDDGEVELLHPKPSLLVFLLLDTTNLDLYEEEVDNMPEDQTASADTFMVLFTLL